MLFSQSLKVTDRAENKTSSFFRQGLSFDLSGIESAKQFERKYNISSRSKKNRRSPSHQNIFVNVSSQLVENKFKEKSELMHVNINNLIILRGKIFVKTLRSEHWL